eukprot:12758338-Alexandrium_andersonii.AAC.1
MQFWNRPGRMPQIGLAAATATPHVAKFRHAASPRAAALAFPTVAWILFALHMTECRMPAWMCHHDVSLGCTSCSRPGCRACARIACIR